MSALSAAPRQFFTGNVGSNVSCTNATHWLAGKRADRLAPPLTALLPLHARRQA